MTRERALAIVNPAAGNGTGAKLLPRLARDLGAAGIDVDVIATPAPGEAARLASHAVEDGYLRVSARSWIPSQAQTARVVPRSRAASSHRCRRGQRPRVPQFDRRGYRWTRRRARHRHVARRRSSAGLSRGVARVDRDVPSTDDAHPDRRPDA
ncbi:MAG: hypothetical protein E6J38_08100 [Chloroflexi bacterium]|nr:MAG: hypothetical protein E6J38_08100 [Chloroflexota bacterium]